MDTSLRYHSLLNKDRIFNVSPRAEVFNINFISITSILKSSHAFNKLLLFGLVLGLANRREKKMNKLVISITLKHQ